jgi:hypothetical protein
MPRMLLTIVLMAVTCLHQCSFRKFFSLDYGPNFRASTNDNDLATSPR